MGNDMECLVTGGAGFIGSHIAEALLKSGKKVRILDNFYSGRRQNIASFVRDVELIEGDIRDQAVVTKAVRGVDVVFHEAAIPSVPRSVREPLPSHEVNVNGTFGLLLAAKEAGVSRFVYASSSSAYGDTPTLPKAEEMPPAPLSPYAVQKLAAEYYTRVFYHVYGLPTVALRYFNVFGPRQDPGSEYAAVIPKFITRMMAKTPPLIYGDGTQTRDFTYIENVVSANMLAAESDKCLGEVMNISTGQRLDLITLAEMIGSVLGVSIAPIFEPPRGGDIKHSFGSIDKAKRLLGYSVRVGMDEGLSRTVQWYREEAPR
jgi:nucleoside-diphosphate-sugar epimerase